MNDAREITIEVSYNYSFDQNCADKIRFSDLKSFVEWYRKFKGKGNIWDIKEV